jgi:hypothetical protein
LEKTHLERSFLFACNIKRKIKKEIGKSIDDQSGFERGGGRNQTL